MEEDMAEAVNYTLDEIKTYWYRYWETSGLRYMVNGRWQYDFRGKRVGLIDATRAEIALLRNYISFPAFLEKYGKNKH